MSLGQRVKQDPILYEDIILLASRVQRGEELHYGKSKCDAQAAVGVCIAIWFNFYRPDDFRNSSMSKVKKGDTEVVFTVHQSKVDQFAEGFRCRMICACGVTPKAPHSDIRICPVHATDHFTYKSLTKIAEGKFRMLFKSVCSKYYRDKSFSQLYSLRCGGAQAAAASLPEEYILLLGRWASRENAQEYLRAAVLDVPKIILVWPLSRPQIAHNPFAVGKHNSSEVGVRKHKRAISLLLSTTIL